MARCKPQLETFATSGDQKIIPTSTLGKVACLRSVTRKNSFVLAHISDTSLV